MPTLTTLTSNGGSGATSYATASVSPTGGRLILVSIHAYISTGSVQPATPAVTGNGITYTLIRSRTVDTSGVDRANVFVFRGVSATSGAITIDFGAVTMTRCSWIVEETDSDVDLSGANGMGAIVQTVDAISGSGATSLSVNYAPAITTGNAGYSIWGHQVQEGKTPRTNWTELADVTAVTLSCLESQWINGTDSAASASWTTGSRAGGIALELKKLPPFIWWDQYALQGGTTSLTMVPPAGTAAGDFEVIWVLNKNSSADPTDPSGGAAGTWHRIDSFEVGTGADGVGTGKIRITGWYRILATASTNTAITIAGANRSLGGGMVYKLTAGGTWAVPTMSFGSDTDSSTTTFLATMADDLAADVDEYLLSIGAFTAITSLNGRALTATGTTSSRLDNINSAGGAVGNEIFTWTDQRVIVAGTQSGASSTGATSGVGTTGGAAHIRIGLAAGDVTATPGAVAAVVAVPAAAPSAGVTQSPEATSAVVTLPAAQPSLPRTVTPAQTSVVVAAPQASPSGAAGPAPATVTSAVAVPTATIRTDATVSPATIAAAVTAPQAGAAVQVAPGTVAAAAAVPLAVSAGGSATAAPAAVAAVAALPAATSSAAAAVSPAPVTATASIPQAARTAGATVAAGVIVTTVIVPRPTGSVTAGPAAITVVTALPAAAPVAAANVTRTPDTIAAAAAVPLATPEASGPSTAIPGMVTAPAGSLGGAVSPAPGAPSGSTSGSTNLPGSITEGTFELGGTIR